MNEEEKIEEKSDIIEGLTKDQQVLITKELLRKTPEYQVCWELELWKKQEKEKFKTWINKQKQLKRKLFNEENQKKEKKLKKIYDSKTKELLKLEKELNKSIKEVTKKEDKVKSFEKELRRRRDEIESDFKRKVLDLKHNTQLVREEAAHKINLSNTSLLEKDKTVNLFKLKIKSLEKKNKQLMDDYNKTCQKYMNSNHVQLSSENAELKRRLEEAISSKKNYKIQWKRGNKLLEIERKKHENRTKKLLDKIMSIQNHFQKAYPYVVPYNQLTIPQKGENLLFNQRINNNNNNENKDDQNMVNARSLCSSELKNLRIQLEEMKIEMNDKKKEEMKEKKKEKNHNSNGNVVEKNFKKMIEDKKDESRDTSISGLSSDSDELINQQEKEKNNIPIEELEVSPPRKENQKSIDNNIKTLTRKIATLLNSGNYQEGDPLILKMREKLDTLIGI